jgi:intracellular multiplication protein IcmP
MAAPAQQQPQGDNSLGALWLALFFFLAMGLIWYIFHQQIVSYVLKIKYIEAVFISLFTETVIPLANTANAMSHVPVPFNDLKYIVQLVGEYIRYPAAIILVIMAGVVFYGHPTMRFKRTHTMKSLLDQERFNWPQIMPVSTVDLVKIHIDQGPWAMALTPMQFAKKHKLLYEERETSEIIKIGAQREKVNVGVLRAEAHQVFAMQLGQYWQGVDKLPMHVKALFVIFSARANRDQDCAKNLLDQLATSSISGQLDFTDVDMLAKKYKDGPLVTKVIQRHAFMITVMASMLQLAREDGVVASSDFLWLKLVDRNMWFMLNAIGRQTPPSEISGAFAHWLAEKKLGRRISVPMVEEAVKALELAIKDVIYVPDEGR